jgi:hypothetical protein
MDWTGPQSLLRSFERHLRAENRSPTTVATYLVRRVVTGRMSDRGRL